MLCPSDPDVIIKLDTFNAFDTLCLQLTLDVLGVLGGQASCDYTCGLKEGDNIETVCEELLHMFEYFRVIRTTKSHLHCLDYCGTVLDTWGKTSGQQGDPLELIVFCLSIHHLWGRTLNKHHQDASDNANPSGVFFTLFLRSFILLRELGYVVEPPWSEAVQKATNGARGGLPVLQYTRKH